MKYKLTTLVLMAALAVGCSHTPPNLSPAAKADYQKTQVVKALDLFRDAAIDANAQAPSLVSTDTTRQIVLYHQSAIKVIAATDSGWQALVSTLLDEALAKISAADKAKIDPYVALLRAVLAGVK